MAKPDFEFIGDERSGILRIVLRNHWDLAIVDRFKAEEQLWWGRMSLDPAHNPFPYLLIDTTEHGVQSQEIVVALRDHIENRPKILKRTAIVIGGALHKMQTGRVRSNSEDHRLCRSMEEALTWLSSDGEARADAA